MSLVLVEFQIPITEDKTIGNAKLHPPYRWKRLQNVLFERFEGLTFTGLVKGV
jgi:hypothetical protein